MKHIILLVSLLVGFSLSQAPLNAQYRQSLLPAFVSSNALHIACDVQVSKEWLYDADEWLGSDKVKHFGASLLLVMLGSKELLVFDRSASSMSAVGSALLVGFVKEVIDDLKPNNIFSLKDLVADLLGIGLAVFLLSLTTY